MKIVKTNSRKNQLIQKIQGLVYRLDNTGNSNIKYNGELNFIKDVCEHYRGKKWVFFDIGANKGEYTELILKYATSNMVQLHLFEPQKSCIELLNKKFSQHTDIRINKFGLSLESQHVILYKDKDQSGLASVYKRNLDYHNIKLNEVEKVTLQSASEYIKEQSINKINFIKIDIEGHELEALRGFGNFLKPENIDLVQFEYGGANLDSHTSLLELFNFFGESGFVLCKIMRNHLEIKTYHPSFENFIYQNWVAVNPELIT